MSIQTALDEYNLALKQGQKEYRELVMELSLIHISEPTRPY